MTRPFQIYGTEVSYFTGKARAAFRAKGIFFEECLPTPKAFVDVLLKRTGLAFLPTIITPEDDTWQDTSDILDALEARFPEPALFPATPLQSVVALLLELYADEFLVVPALHYRWSYPESEWKARRDFGAATGNLDAANQFADRIKAFTPKIGITESTRPAIEAHVEALLETLETHFSFHPFLLGDRPSIADCALMGPFYAHFYLDVVPGRLLRERAPHTCHWIERMNHPQPARFGDFLADDAIPESLRDVLSLLGRDATAMLLDNVTAFETWADRRPDESDEPPRIVGSHETTICGVAVERATSAYGLWMLQRPLDVYRGLAAAERRNIDDVLAGTGCTPLLEARPRHRLGKRDFKLVFESGG